MQKKYVYLPAECFYCNKSIEYRSDHTYDHIIPLAQGGTNTLDNVVDCCISCNRLKSDKSLEVWRKDLKQQIKGLNSNHPKFIHYNVIILTLEEALGGENDENPFLGS